jgi:hypothetical protein
MSDLLKELSNPHHVKLYRGVSQPQLDELKRTGLMHPTAHGGNQATVDREIAELYAKGAVDSEPYLPGHVVEMVVDRSDVREDPITKGDFAFIRPTKPMSWSVSSQPRVPAGQHGGGRWTK